MKKPYLYLLLFYFCNISAQDYFSILEKTGQTMLNSAIESERVEASKEFERKIDSLISNDSKLIDADLSEIKSLSALISPDKKFRIFTWSLPLNKGEIKFYGRVIFLKDKVNKVLVLVDGGLDRSKIETKKLGPESWPGAVYYDLIKKKRRKKEYYILLGWNGNDAFSNKKVIEVLQFDLASEKLSFGAPIFQGKRLEYRKIFEYSEKASMSLKFWLKGDKIVFDHLSPIEISQKDQFEFYSPDFTYDVYTWVKGRWILETNIDMRNDGLNEGDQKKKPQKGLEQR
ncbi:MAG: hypothetical protein WED33_08240 [Bacteroidia bacterium]